MALDVTCDYCGEEISGTYVPLKLGDVPSMLHLDVERVTYTYCAECSGQVVDVLDAIFRWAHRREGSGLVWSLKEQTPAPATADRRDATLAEIADRARTPVRGTLTIGQVDQLSAKARSALWSAGVRTLEEAAERSALELLMHQGVGQGTVEKVTAAMESHGLSLRPSASIKQVGERLRAEREARGLSRYELAELVNPFDPDHEGPTGKRLRIYGETVGQFERGSRAPAPAQLAALCEALGLSVDEVIAPEAV